MSRQYKFAVYIGRFQPFHIGHQHALEKALEIADHALVLIGTAKAPATIKNPWSVDERKHLIKSAMSHRTDRLSFAGIEDSIFEGNWIANVQEAVWDQFGDTSNICIVGHSKDASSYYLKVFPQWDFIDLGYMDFHGSTGIDATGIRDHIFEGKFAFIKSLLHEKVFENIMGWTRFPVYQNLVEEYKYIKAYKAKWSTAPYPPTIVTADAVVVQSGHILTVTRKNSPGANLLALPGGHVNQDERLKDCAIRELVEETKIKIQPEVLDRCIEHSEVFDDPGRSLRGRVITQAFLFHLNDSKDLPKVSGGDDAKSARWMTFREYSNSRHQFFEDHWEIGNYMISKLKS